MESRLRNLFLSVFQIPNDCVLESVTQESLPGWDSITHLSLILSLEREFGIRFNEDEFPKLDSFSSVLTLVLSKTAEITVGE
jgi:acyl carrier protein